ncbi:hypothetical protein STVIR_3341 [Streptomyces viridochromogenes Tue57]|uniref:Uncharacterized protein n=1 Tax=Streptomyces viridochromogenes Tue57 TaxID=1160705 RepID=L8PHP3_STRVR|nr:hypothetical protein STVIR_3341 [Streptomyces viridochromogenes Tue57]
MRLNAAEQSEIHAQSPRTPCPAINGGSTESKRSHQEF